MARMASRWILAEMTVVTKIPGMLQKLGHMDDALFRIGNDLRNKAEFLAPFETGALKASLSVTTKNKSDFTSRVAAARNLRPEAEFDVQSEPPDNAVDVHAPIHYATYQELGTRQHAAQPYLIPAISMLDPGDAVFTDILNVGETTFTYHF